MMICGNCQEILKMWLSMRLGTSDLAAMRATEDAPRNWELPGPRTGAVQN